jgi:hypothetical protein
MRQRVILAFGAILTMFLLWIAAKAASGASSDEQHEMKSEVPDGFEAVESLIDDASDQTREEQLKKKGLKDWVIRDNSTIGNFTWTLTARHDNKIEPGDKVHVFLPILNHAKITVKLDDEEVWAAEQASENDKESKNLLSPEILIKPGPLAGDERLLRIAVVLSDEEKEHAGVKNVYIVRQSRLRQIYRYSVSILVCGWVLLAVVLTSGRRQLLAGAALGVVVSWTFLLVLVPGHPTQSSVHDWVPVGFFSVVFAAIGILLVGGMQETHAKGREGFPWFVLTIPYALLLGARAQISPWEWKPQPASSLFARKERGDRFALTLAAIGGASAGAALAQWEALLEVFSHLFTVQGLVGFLLLIFLNAAFLIPLHHALVPGHENKGQGTDPAAHGPSDRPAEPRPWYWYVMIPAALLPVEFLGLVFHHSVSKHFLSETVFLGVLNAQVAGVATYYFAAAYQAQAASITRRAAVSASYLGAVIYFPAIYVPTLILFPYPDFVSLGAEPGGGGLRVAIEFCIIICLQVLLAAGVALLLAALSFGVYAAAGAWAIERKDWRLPVYLRIPFALLLVEVVRSGLLSAAFYSWLKDSQVAWDLFLTGLMGIAVWGVGMGISLLKSDIFQNDGLGDSSI